MDLEASTKPSSNIFGSPVLSRLFFYCICNIMMLGNFAFHPQKDVLFMPVKFSGFLTSDLSSSRREELDICGDESCFIVCWVYMHFYKVRLTLSRLVKWCIYLCLCFWVWQIFSKGCNLFLLWSGLAHLVLLYGSHLSMFFSLSNNNHVTSAMEL